LFHPLDLHYLSKTNSTFFSEYYLASAITEKSRRGCHNISNINIRIPDPPYPPHIFGGTRGKIQKLL
jgi:hypothetical protein